MKMFAYNVREDEEAFFRQYAQTYGIEIETSPGTPDRKSAWLAKGYDCVSVITTAITADILDVWNACNVRCISTRTIGFDHIDCKYARELGMAISNVTYSSASVADYTVMLALMACRKMNVILKRFIGQDYSLKGVRGRELHNMTVGVVGTGKIGEAVIERLRGFGCSILAYDILEKESLREKADYVSFEELMRCSDLITFHAPATERSYHMIHQGNINMLKEGVILVNTARGTIIETEALLQGLESGRIGGAALDVVENEMGIYYKDFKDTVIGHREMAILSAMPNVIMTPHTAFFTDQAVSDMVENSIKSCVLEYDGETNPWRVI